ncbi:pantoate--beta-alanine ligase [Mesobacillus foraminis]|uniref:pantoate--beta-alanine ligase n=1 Tax=Mesobacillus foraminis TaxID=279826 RepID=UPI001BE75347|nr:pantoate--beta-alanine ligase [Mesobacillus foraminis]MBT2754934.1 pantoate--beta-alanine ligase [Mesobacillus foraminis]
MRIITRVKEMQAEISALKAEGRSIGFVPTMGFLHEGHITLLTRAKKENEILVLSIFVNPLQFGPGEDLDAYPRDFDRDRARAENAGVDFIFYPSAEEMYPKPPSVKVTVQERTDVLCGASRPGHFDGVATVLTKLFHIIMPDRVYFGLKDAQQAAVVDSLIKDFHFPVEMVPVPTVREEDGLAKSSRNVYLDQGERSQAAHLYKSLQDAREAIEKGERNPETLIEMVRAHLNNHCEAAVDYVNIYSYPELKPLRTLTGNVIIALAVKFSKARLIDNLILEVE